MSDAIKNRKSLSQKIAALPPEKRMEFVLDEIQVLEGQMDAHRAVLFWLLSRTEGADAFVSAQANEWKCSGEDNYKSALIEELDTIREWLSDLKK